MRSSFKVLAGTFMIFSACCYFTFRSNGTSMVNTATSYSENKLPEDVYPSCTVTQGMFNQWFASGRASANGLVVPANSTGFLHRNNCDFYQWSEQMFLWLTSPVAGIYGNKGSVLESSVFYDVSPEDPLYQRALIPHDPGHIFNMSSHLEKTGPNKLPVVRERSGRLFEVERHTSTSSGLPVILNREGNQVEVSRIEKTSDELHAFFDRSGNRIQNPTAVIMHRKDPGHILQEIISGNEHVLLDKSGNEVRVETSQATGDVLITQTGSLVYYLTMVNDVYAYYVTAAKGNLIGRSTFPTTAAARDSICAYARTNNKILPDSNALAMEVKTAWVEVTNLPDSDRYVTVKALIPVYNRRNKDMWIPESKRVARMALIGIHVVGSVAGHPEMIWATFEHKSNSPNAAYAYLDYKKTAKTVTLESGQRWLLSNTADTASLAYNFSHATSNMLGRTVAFDSTLYSDTIRAKHPGSASVSPSNTRRLMPWGSAMNAVTNREDSSSAASNSEVISINNSIRSMLIGKDTRKNYLFMGAVWTNSGAPPDESIFGVGTVQTSGAAIGTSVLANTTMETYFQSSSTTCFTCHSSSVPSHPSNSPDSLSHVFTTVQPLVFRYKLAGNKSFTGPHR